MRFRDWFGQLDRGHRVLVCTWGSVFFCMLFFPYIVNSELFHTSMQNNGAFSYIILLPIIVSVYCLLLASQWLVFGPGSVLVRWLISLFAFKYSLELNRFFYSNSSIVYSFTTAIIFWTILRGFKLLELKTVAEVERDRHQPWQFTIKYLLVVITILPLLLFFPSYFQTFEWRNFFGLAQFLLVTNLLVLGTHSGWWNLLLLPWAMTSWCWLYPSNEGITTANYSTKTQGTAVSLTWIEMIFKLLREVYMPLLQFNWFTLILCTMTAVYLGLLWCQRYAGYRLVLNRSQPTASADVATAESVNALVD